MAEVMSEWKGRARGPGQKYPWDEWLDGQVWKLRFKEDFASRPQSFVQAVYLAAKRKGIRVRTSRSLLDDVVEIQAYGLDDENERDAK